MPRVVALHGFALRPDVSEEASFGATVMAIVGYLCHLLALLRVEFGRGITGRAVDLQQPPRLGRTVETDGTSFWVAALGA